MQSNLVSRTDDSSGFGGFAIPGIGVGAQLDDSRNGVGDQIIYIH